MTVTQKTIRLGGSLALLTTLAALTALSACGSDDDAAGTTGSAAVTTTASPAATTTAPTSGPASTPDPTPDPTPAPTPGATGVASTPASGPSRIVSISPSATETLFAIGAGEQVIAVDDQSNYPEEAAAKMTDLSGFTPNIEAIAAFDPDLVVIGDDSQGVSAQLEGLGIDTVVQEAPVNFDDIYVQVLDLGTATGHAAEASELVRNMKTDVQAALDSIAVAFEVAPTVYHELYTTLFSINSNTFIGQIYSMFGLHNIADTAEGGSDYPQLSAEFVISQNPDLIFLADAKCCGESPETVAARPGWGEIAAVKEGHVVPVDEDVASRWGPRIVQYVEFVAAAINDLGG
jgi:iron complex transport system substrate-binding protein